MLLIRTINSSILTLINASKLVTPSSFNDQDSFSRAKRTSEVLKGQKRKSYKDSIIDTIFHLSFRQDEARRERERERDVVLILCPS